jgi:chromosomal replication initiator protein
LPDVTLPGTDLGGCEVWRQVLAELRMQMTQATFDTWLRGSRVIRVDDQRVVVRVRDGYAVEWLKERWIVPIQRTLAGIVGQGLDVEFVVGEV